MWIFVLMWLGIALVAAPLVGASMGVHRRSALRHSAHPLPGLVAPDLLARQRPTADGGRIRQFPIQPVAQDRESSHGIHG